MPPAAGSTTGRRYLVWVSIERPVPEYAAAGYALPFNDVPYALGADSSTEAIAAAIGLVRGEGIEVNRVTATLLPTDYVTPPTGPYAP